MQSPVKRKRATKNLVPIGTHVPMATKITITALAESEGKTVYELLQGLINDLASEYEEELQKLKGDSTDKEEQSSDGESLL